MDTAAASEAGYLANQGCGYDFMVSAASLDLKSRVLSAVSRVSRVMFGEPHCGQDSPVLGGQVAH